MVIDDYPLSKREIKRWRQLLRAVAYLGVRRAVAPKGGPRYLEEVLRLAGCTLRTLSPAEQKSTATFNADADMLIDLNGKIAEEKVAAFLSAPGKIAIRKNTNPANPDTIPGDLILQFRDIYLTLSRPGMARTLYTL